MRTLIFLTALLSASPALAESENFFSLRSTEFVVMLAFLLFIGVLIALKVPSKVVALLDKRANDIQADLNEARALRDEAQSLLASFEKKRLEVKDQAERIVAHARVEAAEAAEAAKADIEKSLARRMKAAEEQITQAEARAVRDVRDQAVTVAIAAARDVISGNMSATDGNKLIDDAIKEVGERLH